MASFCGELFARRRTNGSHALVALSVAPELQMGRQAHDDITRHLRDMEILLKVTGQSFWVQ